MVQYYKTRPSTANLNVSEENEERPSTGVHTLTEFNKHHITLLSYDAEEGWASELRQYLSTMQ